MPLSTVFVSILPGAGLLHKKQHRHQGSDHRDQVHSEHSVRALLLQCVFRGSSAGDFWYPGRPHLQHRGWAHVNPNPLCWLGATYVWLKLILGEDLQPDRMLVYFYNNMLVQTSTNKSGMVWDEHWLIVLTCPPWCVFLVSRYRQRIRVPDGVVSGGLQCTLHQAEGM